MVITPSQQPLFPIIFIMRYLCVAGVDSSLNCDLSKFSVPSGHQGILYPSSIAQETSSPLRQSMDVLHILHGVSYIFNIDPQFIKHIKCD